MSSLWGVDVDAAEEDYMNAIYDLVQVICNKDAEIARLTVYANQNPEDASAKVELIQRKADAIAKYTQQVERGGLN